MRVIRSACPSSAQMRPLVCAQAWPGLATRPRTARETVTMSRPVSSPLATMDTTVAIRVEGLSVTRAGRMRSVSAAPCVVRPSRSIRVALCRA